MFKDVEEYRTKSVKDDLVQIAKVLIGIILIIVSFAVIIDGIRYPECYMAHARSDFMNDIESGDADAIERYRDKFIEPDRYIYDGPITIKMMCEKYELDYESVWTLYKKSNMTAQDFYNKVISDIV